MVLNKKDIIPIFSKDSSNINKILNLGVYESTIVSTDEYGRREIFEVKKTQENTFHIHPINENYSRRIFIVNGVKKAYDELDEQIDKLLSVIKENSKSVFNKLINDIDNDYNIIIKKTKEIIITKNKDPKPFFRLDDEDEIKKIYDKIPFINKDDEENTPPNGKNYLQPLTEAVLKEPKKLIDGEKYKLKENIICLDKSLLDYFSRGDNSFFGEETLKHLINASMIKDNKIEKNSILVYNEQEKAFIDEATDRRIFLSEDNLTFMVDKIEDEDDFDLGEGEENQEEQPESEGEENQEEQPESEGESIDDELEKELNN